MIPLSSSASLLALSAAQAHLTLLLKQGKIFDPLFRPDSSGRGAAFLAELRSCPMCLGVWTAVGVALLAGVYDPTWILAVAGVGHVFFLLREKYLPCGECRMQEVEDPGLGGAVPFKRV